MSNCPEIPAGWEKGTENAFTHGLTASGEIYELQDEFPGILIAGSKITFKSWCPLGIIPVRRAKPMELVVERIEIASGRLCLLVSLDGAQLDRPAADRMVGKKFQEIFDSAPKAKPDDQDELEEELLNSLGKAEEVVKPVETPAKAEVPVDIPAKLLEKDWGPVKEKPEAPVVRGESDGEWWHGPEFLRPETREGLQKPKVQPVPAAKPDSEMPPGWTPSAVVAKSGPKRVVLTPDENISMASRLASELQTSWEGFLAEVPLVPRPKAGKWLAKYSPEEYLDGLVELALTSKTDKFPPTSVNHIRESDGELIGYILLLEKRVGTAQRERFCAELLAQQKARVK